MRAIQFKQNLPVSLDQAWAFLSDPRNLKIITPPGMGFDIATPDLAAEMYAGMVISYRVKPLLGIPLTWVSEITHVRAPLFFVDEQRFGPYRFWHHQHFLQKIPGGVEMRDLIHYQIPGKWIGDRLAPWLVVPKLRQIFSFREKKLIELFGPYEAP